jgi:hypothetical protein
MDIVNAQELEHMLNTSTKVTKEIRLLYNDKKALQVLNSFVVLAGGNIDKYLAVKLMYLFEREMLLRTGTPSLFGRLCSIPFGPIISEINDAVDSTEISALPYHDNIWQKHFSLKGNVLTSINDNLGNELLSNFEDDLIAELFSEFHSYSFEKLKKYTHTLPEHTETNSRIDIGYYDFFIKNGFSKDESEKLIQEIGYQVFFHNAMLKNAK